MISTACSRIATQELHHFLSCTASAIGRRQSRFINNNRVPNVFPGDNTTRLSQFVRDNDSNRCFHSTSVLAKGGGKKLPSTNKKRKNKEHPSKSKHSNNIQHNPYQNIPDPVEQQRKEAKTQQQEVPPAYLVKTASDYAYIAKCVIMDEQTGELLIDPRTLFSEIVDSSTHHDNNNNNSNNNNKQGKQQKRSYVPQIFKQSHFHYFPPSTFPNHEPPTDGTPEVAFLGRSNTGKSSLINALSAKILRSGGGSGGSSASGGGELARTSKRPGRTQQINYFGLVPNNSVSASSSTSVASFKGKDGMKHPNSSQSKMFLVDLPGFGYASAPDKDVDAWQERTQAFLISRASTPSDGGSVQSWVGDGGGSPPLKRLYVLVDSRLPQPTLLDLSVMGWCDDYAIPYTIVLTKVDGSSRAHCVRLTNQLCMRYHSLHVGISRSNDEEGDGEVYMDPIVYWTSSKDGLGMEELLMSVESNSFAVEDEEIGLNDPDEHQNW